MEVQDCCCIIHKITTGWQWWFFSGDKSHQYLFINSHSKLLTSIVSWLEASFKSPLLFYCYRNNFTCDCTINEGYHTGSEHPSYQVPTRVHSKFLIIKNLDISHWHHIFLHPTNMCFPPGINWKKFTFSSHPHSLLDYTFTLYTFKVQQWAVGPLLVYTF